MFAHYKFLDRTEKRTDNIHRRSSWAGFRTPKSTRITMKNRHHLAEKHELYHEKKTSKKLKRRKVGDHHEQRRPTIRATPKRTRVAIPRTWHHGPIVTQEGHEATDHRQQICVSWRQDELQHIFLSSKIHCQRTTHNKVAKPRTSKCENYSHSAYHVAWHHTQHDDSRWLQRKTEAWWKICASWWDIQIYHHANRNQIPASVRYKYRQGTFVHWYYEYRQVAHIRRTFEQTCLVRWITKARRLNLLGTEVKLTSDLLSVRIGTDAGRQVKPRWTLQTLSLPASEHVKPRCFHLTATWSSTACAAVICRSPKQGFHTQASPIAIMSLLLWITRTWSPGAKTINSSKAIKSLLHRKTVGFSVMLDARWDRDVCMGSNKSLKTQIFYVSMRNA